MNIKKIEEYPLLLMPQHVAEIMGCSLPTAYKVMDHQSFPGLKVGRLRWVGRDAFFQWVNDFTTKGMK